VGLFWKRSNGKGAFWGLLSGLFVAAAIMVAKYLAGAAIPVHFLLLAPVVMVLSILVNVVVSLSTGQPDPDKVEKNTWTVKIWKEESAELKGVAWYRNFRVLSALLVAGCFVMYFLFF